MWIERVADAIEALTVALLLGGIVIATVSWGYRVLVLRHPRIEEYTRYRRWLARALLLGMEILVAADIIRTVALQTTWITIAELGAIVLIRTFLSWSIVVEIEGRWPWQPPREGAEKEAA